MKRYLSQHDGNLPIRIICISGRRATLISTAQRSRPGGQSAIRLRVKGYARRSHAGVRFRKSYGESSVRYLLACRKGVCSLRQIEDLIREMEAGKRLLAQRQNVVSQHKILCFWRLVIFSSHCIVQSYFPNEDGSESHHAPVFVFANSTTTGSYYRTFLSMFNQIKQYTTAAPRAGTATGTPEAPTP